MDDTAATLNATAAVITAVNESVKLSFQIGDIFRKYREKRKLDRQAIIRKLLRHCRLKEPEYNVAIFVPGTVTFDFQKDYHFEEFKDFKHLDFELVIYAFKKGHIAVLGSDEKWGFFIHIIKIKKIKFYLTFLKIKRCLW